MDDAAWWRFAAVLPPVVALWCGILWLLGSLVARAPIAPPPRPIDAQLIELPSEPRAPPPRAQVPHRAEKPVAQKQEPAPAPAAPSVEPEPQPAPPIPTPPPAVAALTPTLGVPPAPTAARAVYSPLPVIPDELRDRASTAEALARFTIAADATVSVELAIPTPDPLLNRAILDTLRTWRFAPATKDGKPVASSQVLHIRVEVR